MSLTTLTLVIYGLVIGYLLFQKWKTSKSPKLPRLEEGEHIAIVRKGESNVTIGREGKETFLIDEEQNRIPFKQTLE